MIVTVEIPGETREAIARRRTVAARLPEVFASALNAAVVAGASSIQRDLQTGATRLTMRHPGSGLAGSVMGWMIDESIPLAAMGVPSNAPAAAYAGKLNVGGPINARPGKALAVPLTAEAAQFSSPRHMTDLTFIRREGKPPLLARVVRRRGGTEDLVAHWVLVKSVTIPAFRWFDQTVGPALAVASVAFADVVADWAEEFSGG